MEQALHDYFLERMSAEDKQNLFAKLDTDPALRSRFIELQHTYSTASMLPAETDAEYSRIGMSELYAVKRRRMFIRASRYAAAVLIVAVAGVAGYFSLPKKVVYAETVTAVGKSMELQLSDGTRVWLAPNSKLVYPVKFSRRERTVELTGEALFDVVRDADAPFEVRSDLYNVRVLGTVFSTTAYEDMFETTLVEGLVEVYDSDAPGQRITMKPNECLRLLNGKLESDEADVAFVLGLQNGIYNFHDMTLGEIAEKLELWYDVEINIIADGLAGEMFSAKFRQEDDVETILKTLQKTSQFNFLRDDSGSISIF